MSDRRRVEQGELALPERVDGDRFEELFAAERRFVAGDDEDLSGLAISGGGIRSASFALGVLQALVAGEQLGRFHYLSTVSGGGYLGTSLTWFLKKGLPNGNGEPLEAGTSPRNFPFGSRSREGEGARAQNAVLGYIRKHCSYLSPTPRLGVGALVAVVLRTSFVSLFVHFALLTALMGLLLELRLFDPIPKGVLGRFDGMVRYAPNPLLVAATALLLLFCWSSLLYSVFVRCESGARSYVSRTKIQKHIGRATACGAALAILGALPLLYAGLGRWLSDVLVASALCGGASTAAGAVLAMLESGRHLSENTRPSLLARVRPYFAVVLLLSGLLLGALGLADWLRSRDWQGATVGLGVVGLLLGWLSNVNYLGLHRMYRDRLMELFLPGPAAILRQQWRLARAADTTRIDEMCGVPEHRCKRPYHLINANVVLVDSRASDFRNRGGDSFVLSPLYCGSRATGWVRSSAYMTRSQRGLTLSSAMAISGAAVNPNTGVAGQGFMRNRLASMLLTALNLRLGYWATNPKLDRDRVPNFIFPGLVAGLITGGLHEDASLIELTDGGHFENLGLYELVRRRAKLIVVCDAGADPDFTFGDLANAVERVRVDFGAKIEFRGDYPLEKLVPGSGPKQPDRLDARSSLAQYGFAEGTIRYPEDDPKRPSGRIVYIKATLIPDLPADVLSYKASHPDFPHESTGDQFFSEAQFEAYRELGYNIGWQWLETVAAHEPASTVTPQPTEPAPTPTPAAAEAG